MKNQYLSEIQATAFIPLAARISISQQFPEYFYDEKALKLKELSLVQKIISPSSEFSTIASVSRSYNIDCIVIKFFRKIPSWKYCQFTINYRIYRPS